MQNLKKYKRIPRNIIEEYLKSTTQEIRKVMLKKSNRIFRKYWKMQKNPKRYNQGILKINGRKVQWH